MSSSKQLAPSVNTLLHLALEPSLSCSVQVTVRAPFTGRRESQSEDDAEVTVIINLMSAQQKLFMWTKKSQGLSV